MAESYLLLNYKFQLSYSEEFKITSKYKLLQTKVYINEKKHDMECSALKKIIYRLIIINKIVKN